MDSNIEKIFEINSAMQSNDVVSLDIISKIINNSKGITEYYDLGYSLKSWMLAYLVKNRNISALKYITNFLEKPLWDTQYWQTLTKDLKPRKGSIDQEKVVLAKLKGTLPRGYGKTAKEIIESDRNLYF